MPIRPVRCARPSTVRLPAAGWIDPGAAIVAAD